MKRMLRNSIRAIEIVLALASGVTDASPENKTIDKPNSHTGAARARERDAARSDEDQGTA
jgi:hypothetical protein